MQVETYECSETAAEPIEACEEAVRIMEELGLDGQKSLVQPAIDDKPVRRVPYREMTDEEQFVYGVLCPGRATLKAYNCGPIPLRVLQVAAHANGLGVYKELAIWHAKSREIPDPVLVATIQRGQYSWETQTFILARWGDELESWPTLMKRAVESKRRQVADIYVTLLRKLQAYAAGDQLTMEELISKGATWAPSLTI